MLKGIKMIGHTQRSATKDRTQNLIEYSNRSLLIIALSLISACGGGSDSQSDLPFSPEPVAANTAPTFMTTNDRVTVFEDEVLNSRITIRDESTDTVTGSATVLPTNGVIEFSEKIVDRSFRYFPFTYTPAENYFGSDSFQFRVIDDKGNRTTQDIILDVVSVNDRPVITIVESTSIGEFETKTITASASDIDGEITSTWWDLNTILENYLVEKTDTTITFKGSSYPYVQDFNFSYGARDNDGDFTNKFTEVIFAEGLDLDDDHVTDFSDFDDDNDGFSDYYELTFGTDPLNRASFPIDRDPIANGIDFLADDDNDGFLNYQEISENTNPFDPESVPVRDLPRLDSLKENELGPLPVGCSPDKDTFDFGGGDYNLKFNFTGVDGYSNIKSAKVLVGNGPRVPYIGDSNYQGLIFEKEIEFPGLVVADTLESGQNSDTQYLNNTSFWMECYFYNENNQIIDRVHASNYSSSSANGFSIINNSDENIDIEAPELIEFTLPEVVNIDNGDTSIPIGIKFQDKIGAVKVSVTFLEENRIAHIEIVDGLPVIHSRSAYNEYDRIQNVDEILHSHEFDNSTEPGEWKVVSISLFDSLGNSKTHYEDQLIAMGFSTRFTMINSFYTGP